MSFNKEKIQELYPGAKMYEAQKISKGTESLLKSACNSGEYFGELKKDGYLVGNYKSSFLPFGATEAGIKIKINDKMICEITDNSQVDENTKFND